MSREAQYLCAWQTFARPRRKQLAVASPPVVAPALLQLSPGVDDFNTARPHSAISYLTPAAYAAALKPRRAPALRQLRWMSGEGHASCSSSYSGGKGGFWAPDGVANYRACRWRTIAPRPSICRLAERSLSAASQFRIDRTPETGSILSSSTISLNACNSISGNSILSRT